MFTQELISLIGCALIASSLLSLWRSVSIKIVTGIGFISALLLLLWFLSRWHYYLQAMGTNLFLSFPVATFYESVIFLVILTLVVSGCIPRKFSSLKLTGAINMLCGAVLLSLNFFQNVSSPSLFLPSLRSYWLVSHVFFNFICYCLFFIAGRF